VIGLDGRDLLVSLVTGVAVAAAVRLALPPTPRLAGRVRPYTVASRTALGRSADVRPVADPGPLLSPATLQRLLRPLIERLASRVGAVVDRTGDEALLLRLRQAGMLRDVAEDARVQEHRVRQLTGALVWGVGLGGAALAVGAGPVAALLLAVLGLVAGVARWRGRIDREIEARRARLRIELYTVNQLLAMHARVGGGVVQAIQHVVDRGSGAVVEDLAEVLRLHRGGRRIGNALQHASRLTPEPHAARSYRLLANGVEHGADLAESLRTLSEDLRTQRAEAMRRAATRRRAAMLVPIIAILAPVMLLFIAAPLPSIVLGFR
jgi:Flp pilus assembly protein TadB